MVKPCTSSALTNFKRSLYLKIEERLKKGQYDSFTLEYDPESLKLAINRGKLGAYFMQELRKDLPKMIANNVPNGIPGVKKIKFESPEYNTLKFTLPEKFHFKGQAGLLVKATAHLTPEDTVALLLKQRRANKTLIVSRATLAKISNRDVAKNKFVDYVKDALVVAINKELYETQVAPDTSMAEFPFVGTDFVKQYDTDIVLAILPVTKINMCE